MRRSQHVTFQVAATDGAARAGVLQTAHGEVRTPAFLALKDDLVHRFEALGARVEVTERIHRRADGNAQHLAPSD